MEKTNLSGEEKKARARKTKANQQAPGTSGGKSSEKASLADLHQQVGNRAVQRLIVQRSGGEGAFELDDDTASRINAQRGAGQALDDVSRERMQAASDVDLGEVRVHTSPEADDLNQQLGAKAFTTGKDIYFRDGEYQPHTSGGQELLAHELTHVVQQGSGALHSGGRMRVNAPGDAYEQQAEAVASSVTGLAASGVQLQEEEEEVQMQEKEEEEMVQTQEEDEEEMAN